MRVLIAIRESSHSEAALRLVAQVARRSARAPTILTVVKRPSERPLADATLARARKLLQPQIPHARAMVRVGHPVEEIVREVQAGGYDLVIVGETTHLCLSSTAERVLRRVSCPLVVAKGRVGPIHRILLCDSGAACPEPGRRAGPSMGLNGGPSVISRFTASLAELFAGQEEITVLHVMSQMSAGPGIKGAQLRAGAEELIAGHAPEGRLFERDLQALERLGLHPRPKVRHGLVVDEIVQDARSGDYDLVVIGAHRGQGWQRLLLDDLAHKIMVQLDRPVLMV
jgi:nucleotide-binding universal stress UspA family protein